MVQMEEALASQSLAFLLAFLQVVHATPCLWESSTPVSSLRRCLP